MSATPLYSGFAPLAERYDGFIVDLWGVLHDGVAAFPDAVACLEKLKSRGKRIVILSNAPRRAQEVMQRNQELGIAPELADAVYSSGEDAWRHLKDRADPWTQRLGRRCYHLGPERDHGMRDGLDYNFVQDLGDADFVLLTGTHSYDAVVGDYDDVLQAAKARDLAMICANPDLEVIRGGKREICAGALAAAYEDLGGQVRYHGKPHQDIYAACLPLLQVSERQRVAAIGDSLRTDVAGANGAGIGSVFVCDGIHGETLGLGPGQTPDPARLEALYGAAGQFPSAAVPTLRW